jgi:hypothetical protein
MVIIERVVETSASAAPVLQSSSTSLGKTTVFKPQGIAKSIIVGIIANSNLKNFRIRIIVKGIIISLKRVIKYTVFIFKSFIKLYCERTIPRSNILMGPTGAEAVPKSSVIKEGRVMFKRPNMAPEIIASIAGFKSCFKLNFVLVNLLRPMVYIYTYVGMANIIRLSRNTSPKIPLAKGKPK